MIWSRAFGAAWAVLCVYWLWSARRLKATSRAEPFAKRFLAYWLPLIVAYNLVGPGDWFGDSLLHRRFLPLSTPVLVAGLALTWLGVLFACWARSVLGSNWSSVVKLRQDHELIEQGPYRSIRHPIYTGLIVAFAGTALGIGEWRALLALVIVTVSFGFKLRQEERWLGEQFGFEYAAYRARSWALLPGIL
ncbi:MAG: isoprenylcysteine carboxylmethyltransferase family protein [Thermoanaerobaculia bacterium]